jgi:hypothetical protein
MPGQTKQKRIRKKSIARQLQQALDHARQELETKDRDELSISRIKLAQTLVVTLNKALSRERNDKVKRLTNENASLKAENTDLKIEIARLTEPVPKPMTEIGRVLAQYEASKTGAA